MALSGQRQLFDVLDIRPCLGRFFHASDEHVENSANYLVLSYPYWQNHFQGDRSVVGRIVLLNKHPSPSWAWHPRSSRARRCTSRPTSGCPSSVAARRAAGATLIFAPPATSGCSAASNRASRLLRPPQT